MKTLWYFFLGVIFWFGLFPFASVCMFIKKICKKITADGKELWTAMLKGMPDEDSDNN